MLYSFLYSILQRLYYLLQKPYVMHNLIGKIFVVVVDDSGESILNPNNDEFCQSLIYLFTFWEEIIAQHTQDRIVGEDNGEDLSSDFQIV